MGKAEILNILSNYKTMNSLNYGILELGLYGSVAREQDKEFSDIDIFVKTKEPNPFILVHIKEELEKYFNKHVDIVRYRDNMNPYLKKRIEMDGIYV
jgi:predicted nucleotidyltransferase